MTTSVISMHPLQTQPVDACHKLRFTLSVTSAVLFASFNAYADSSAIDLGTLGGTYAHAQHVSANGSVIVGASMNANGAFHAFKYTADGGMISLEKLGLSSSNAFAVSADGSTIVGLTSDSTNRVHAFKYTDGNGMKDLGVLAGGSYSNALRVSSDGSVITGTSEVTGGFLHAYKYTDGNGMQDIGTLGGNNSEARAMSADGSVIVGYSQDVHGTAQAFKYSDTTGITSLGSLNGPDGYSEAHGISANGAVIVGTTEDQNGAIQAFKYTDSGMIGLGTLGGGSAKGEIASADGSVVVGSIAMPNRDMHAFKHTDSDGMIDLGSLGGSDAYVNGMSANGTVVVGSSSTTNGQTHAYKHTDSGGMVDLGTLGGSNSGASAISTDGTVIVGYAETANGATHAALWKNDIIVDSTNTRAALALTAQQATQVLDMRSAQLQMLMQQDCAVGTADGRLCIGAGATYSGTSNARSTAASFTLGYQLTPQWRIGTTINQSLDSSLPSEYKSSSNLPGIGVFTTFNARKDGLGWQARVAAAYQTSKVDINRKQLAYTEGGIGRADLDGKAAAVEGSYQMLMNNGLIVAPYAALRYSSVNRSAYDESNDVAFVGRYGEMGRSATSIETGLRFGKTINSKLSLFADIGITHDVAVNDRGFSVAMDYVGGFNLGNGDDERTRAHLGVQGSYTLAKDSAIQSGIYWAQQAYGNDSTSAQIRLIRQF